MEKRLVRNIDPIDGRCRLDDGAGGAVSVPVLPDVETARRFCGTVRRVNRVALDVTDGVVSCSVSGVGHRLPFDRSLPVSVGLGLGLMGVPVVLRGGPVG
jgi:hypothetical protein